MLGFVRDRLQRTLEFESRVVGNNPAFKFHVCSGNSVRVAPMQMAANNWVYVNEVNCESEHCFRKYSVSCTEPVFTHRTAPGFVLLKKLFY